MTQRKNLISPQKCQTLFMFAKQKQDGKRLFPSIQRHISLSFAMQTDAVCRDCKLRYINPGVPRRRRICSHNLSNEKTPAGKSSGATTASGIAVQRYSGIALQRYSTVLQWYWWHPRCQASRRQREVGQRRFRRTTLPGDKVEISALCFSYTVTLCLFYCCVYCAETILSELIQGFKVSAITFKLHVYYVCFICFNVHPLRN